MAFTFAFLKSSDPYYPHWVEMRRRYVVGSLVILTLPFSMCLFTWLPGVLFQSTGWFAFCGLAVLLGYIALYEYIIWWPCPRCGNRFYGRSQRNYCRSCNLPEYAPHERY